MVTDCADGAVASRDCRVFATATHGRVRQVRARQRASIRRSAQEPNLPSNKDGTLPGAPAGSGRFYPSGNQ